MFQSRCLYKHNEFQEISTSTEIDKCNQIGLDLKAEIAKLNYDDDWKVNTMVKVHPKELYDLRKENNAFKQRIEELKKKTEDHKEIGRAQVSHTTDNQENNDLKVAALNVKPN